MYLIQCDYDCVYQKDGYCKLESPSIITNDSDKGCMHYIKVFQNNINANFQEQQRPL